MSIASLLRINLLAVSAATCLITNSIAAGGEPGGMDAAAAQGVAPANAAAVGRVLQSTYSTTGNGNGSALPAATFSVVDTTTIVCGPVAGCYIGMEAMVQLAPSGGDWAICLYVDGVSVNCPYQGVNGVSSFVVGNYRAISGLVAKGTHTAELRVYTSTAGGLYRWSVDYRKYKG